jgi:hypothetical protein
MRSTTLPPHQAKRNPMGFPRPPRSEILFLPCAQPPETCRILLRRKVCHRRPPPPRFRRCSLHPGCHSPGHTACPAKKIDQKTASLLFYALQIASSNLKRMDLEKPQPEQVLVDTEAQEKWEPPIATMQEAMPEKEKKSQAQEASATAQPDHEPSSKEDEADLPPGTIQACYQPPDHSKDKSKDKKDARRSRVDPSAGKSTNWWDMSVSKRIH